MVTVLRPRRPGAGQPSCLTAQPCDFVGQALVVPSKSRAFLDQFKRGLWLGRRRCGKGEPGRSRGRLPRAGDRDLAVHGDHVGHGFSRPWLTALSLQYKSRCGGIGGWPASRGDTADGQLSDEIGVEEDVNCHRSIVARDRLRMNNDPVAIYPCSFATADGASAMSSARIEENRSISPMRTRLLFAPSAGKRNMRRPAIRATKRR